MFKLLTYIYWLAFACILAFVSTNSLYAQEEYPTGDYSVRTITTILPFMSEPQSVTVTEIGGNLIFEGDIIVYESGSTPGRGGAATADDDLLWPNSTIPYQIDDHHPKRSDIEWAINHLSNSTNLCFIDRGDDPDIDDYIYFVSVTSGCGLSNIGRQGGRQDIEIGPDCGNTRGSAVHEIMHSAGFYHEQSRDDRDDFVTIHESNIITDQVQNFEKYNQGFWSWISPDGRNLGAYDYGSIMHYGTHGFSRNGRPTITVDIPPGTSSTVIGQRNRLSAGDIRNINILYSAPGSCGSSTPSSDPVTRGGNEDGGSSFDIQYEVELVPQSTQMSCWAAGAAMIVGWEDRVCIDPEEIANGIGYWGQYHLPASAGGGLPPDDTTMFSYWGLTPVPPQSHTVEGFRDLLLRGPLWVAAAVPGAHIRVVTGMAGDGTPSGTILTIHDPWQQGMRRFRMPNTGSTYTETYEEFEAKQATLAARETNIPGAFYIAHP